MKHNSDLRLRLALRRPRQILTLKTKELDDVLEKGGLYFARVLFLLSHIGSHGMFALCRE
jgi:hypothetical protein